MAHTYGTASSRTSSTSATITSANFTVSALDTVLVLLIKTTGATNRAGGEPRFAGLTMKQANQVQKAAASPEASCEIWYLENPPTGAYPAVIPNTNGATVYYTIATGRAASGFKSAFDGAAGSNGTSTNPTPTAVVTTENGDIGFAITAGGWTTWSPSAQAGTVISNNDDGAHGCGIQYILQAAAGSSTLNWTFGTSDDWGAIAVYFKEVPATLPNNFRSPRVGNGMSVGEKVR